MAFVAPGEWEDGRKVRFKDMACSFQPAGSSTPQGLQVDVPFDSINS